MNMSLIELIKDLQSAEFVVKSKSGDTFNVTVGFSHSKPSGDTGDNKMKRSNKNIDGKLRRKKARTDGNQRKSSLYVDIKFI